METFVLLLILAPLLLHLVAGQAVGIVLVVEVGDQKPKVVGSDGGGVEGQHYIAAVMRRTIITVHYHYYRN